MTEATTFTAEELAVMQERAKEVERARRAKASPEEDARDVVAKIDELAEPERTLAHRIAAIIAQAAPGLAPKFTTRYATLGFSDVGQLDEGTFWPNAYAVTELTPDVEARIAALVQQAAG